MGITLAVEFLNRFEAYFLTTMDGVAEHVKAVGMPNFKAMFDTFHANIEEDNPVQSILRHRDIITHVHISETNRGVPGRGHNDWPGIFKALRSTGYDNWLTIESFGRVIPWRLPRPHAHLAGPVREHGRRLHGRPAADTHAVGSSVEGAKKGHWNG